MGYVDRTSRVKLKKRNLIKEEKFEYLKHSNPSPNPKQNEIQIREIIRKEIQKILWDAVVNKYYIFSNKLQAIACPFPYFLTFMYVYTHEFLKILDPENIISGTLLAMAFYYHGKRAGHKKYEFLNWFHKYI